MIPHAHVDVQGRLRLRGTAEDAPEGRCGSRTERSGRRSRPSRRPPAIAVVRKRFVKKSARSAEGVRRASVRAGSGSPTSDRTAVGASDTAGRRPSGGVAEDLDRHVDRRVAGCRMGVRRAGRSRPSADAVVVRRTVGRCGCRRQSSWSWTIGDRPPGPLLTSTVTTGVLGPRRNSALDASIGTSKVTMPSSWSPGCNSSSARSDVYGT